ncbi:MAG: histidinol-phosphatase HisJ family protein [Paramuribaculum sp.]|nr:histidinol-phosphatase HisJ family protein [Paramuribaculum sp.]
MIDLKHITRNETLYNLHSHTQFCDGRAQMEAFAAEAVRRGFTHYGFSPHSPVPIISPCNMHRDKVPVYMAEVKRLQDIHGDKIKFYTSMEVDYLGADWGPSHQYFRDLNLDYIIGSVHFIPSQEGELIDIDGRFENFQRKMHEKFHDDIRYVVNKFYDRSIEMVSRGGFDIIGHLDKIVHNASHYSPGIEDEHWYNDRVNELIDAVIESGKSAEINTKAWAEHHRMFPAVRHWSRLKNAGVLMPVNSDAHVPALIDASRSYALDILASI